MAAFDEAVKPFIALNRLEPDHPLPLVYYFRSFVQAGRTPNPTAVRGLERAAELAPFDLGLRFNLASYQLTAGDLARARSNLVPIAFNPHGGPAAESARSVIARIDSGSLPAGGDLRELLSGAEDAKAE